MEIEGFSRAALRARAKSRALARQGSIAGDAYEPMRAGDRAALQKLPRSANPYPPGTEEAHDWEEAWDDKTNAMKGAPMKESGVNYKKLAAHAAVGAALGGIAGYLERPEGEGKKVRRGERLKSALKGAALGGTEAGAGEYIDQHYKESRRPGVVESTEDTYREMYSTLKYGNPGVADSSIEEAIYWFATDYHLGMDKILAQSPFKPGPYDYGPKGDDAEDMYHQLEQRQQWLKMESWQVGSFQQVVERRLKQPTPAPRTESFKNVKSQINALGLHVRPTGQGKELRIAYGPGKEHDLTAYHTDNEEDAVDTARLMTAFTRDRSPK